MNFINEYYSEIQYFILISIIVTLSIKIYLMNRKIENLEDNYYDMLLRTARDIRKLANSVDSLKMSSKIGNKSTFQDQKKEPPVAPQFNKGKWQV